MARVPAEAKEVARNMAFSPASFPRFGNNEGYLPPAGRNEYYIEAVVDIGQRRGAGQYRVVCLVSNGKVTDKYFSATHYGTGEDAGVRPTFVEFQ